MRSHFERCFEALHHLEGGKSDHHADAGGFTNMGFSRLAYPDEDLENMTLERARFLVMRDYWGPLRLDEVASAAVCFQLLESAFHMDPPRRPRRAVMIAQGALICLGGELKLDGQIGPATVAALNKYPHERALVRTMDCFQFCSWVIGIGGQQDFIRLVEARLPQLRIFLRGWLRRLASLEEVRRSQ